MSAISLRTLVECWPLLFSNALKEFWNYILFPVSFYYHVNIYKIIFQYSRQTSQNHTRVLQQLFTVKPTPTRSLRARAHNFILPLKDNRNFMSRALYDGLCPPSG